MGPDSELGMICDVFLVSFTRKRQVGVRCEVDVQQKFSLVVGLGQLYVNFTPAKTALRKMSSLFHLPR